MRRQSKDPIGLGKNIQALQNVLLTKTVHSMLKKKAYHSAIEMLTNI